MCRVAGGAIQRNSKTQKMVIKKRLSVSFRNRFRKEKRNFSFPPDFFAGFLTGFFFIKKTRITVVVRPPFPVNLLLAREVFLLSLVPPLQLNFKSKVFLDKGLTFLLN
jgi:hypothetical protein